ncbi:MAG: glycosyltransferase family 39 protein [Myxococcales bacterium]|nr:glycosyltransferase family 39 protein [Myxococcales bacterium]
MVALAALPRLAVFPWTENLYGDAVARTELAEKWLASPHWISSFADGAFQFGPLHLYLIGAALEVLPLREHAGRAVSLLFGVLAVVPLYSLSRRLFGWRAGAWACAGFAAWGMHIQFSATAASESLAIFLVLSALALLAGGLEHVRLWPLLASAGAMNLACATRYDAWLLVPLMCATILLEGKDRVRGAKRAVLFGLLCLSFPLAWLMGNAVDHGDPLYPIRYIDDFHRRWFADGEEAWTPLGYRLQNLFFWPGAALVTLSPLVALLGAAGMVRAYRTVSKARWLVWMAVLPAAYFTVRSTLLGSFVPLARFTALQLVLPLPFLSLGLEWLGGASVRRRRLLGGAALALALALPVTLGLFTFRSESMWRNALRPVSPVSTNSPALMKVARFVGAELSRGGNSVVLDKDPRYRDIQVGFFTGLPKRRMARYRYDTFEAVLASADPKLLVRIDGGELERAADMELVPGGVRFRGRVFAELPGFEAPFHVYLRESLSEAGPTSDSE